jgi:hypothetical protein
MTFYLCMFFGPPGSASGSVTQSYESEDPDRDSYQNVTDPPQHWYKDGKPDSQNFTSALAVRRE